MNVGRWNGWVVWAWICAFTLLGATAISAAVATKPRHGAHLVERTVLITLGVELILTSILGLIAWCCD